MAQYGPGVVLYFQFLKYIGCLYMVLCVLSIPALMVYYSGNTAYRFDFKGLIVKTSLGNIGVARPACNTGDSVIYLQCANGYFDKLTNFGTVSKTTEINCVDDSASVLQKFEFSPNTCQLDQWSREEIERAKDYFKANCFEQPSCELKINPRLYPSKKCPKSASTTFVATASCDASKINLFGSKKLSIQKETAALIVVYMDLLAIIVYWFSMILAKPMVSLSHY